MPEVSVVITCFNYGQYLAEAIDSVLAQTFENFEVIVVDDGSTDNTLETMDNYNSDGRIRYFRQENQGQPIAKNRGIKESCGKFIAFLDADDVWMPGKLEKQLHLFENNMVGVVYTRRKWINPNGEEISGNERILRRGKILDYIFIDNFICFSSAMVRRSLFENHGYFDESLPMGIDYDLWIRLAAHFDFDYIDEPLVKYRTGHSNLSKNTIRRYECAQYIMRKTLGNNQIAGKFSWYVPRLAWADTWSNMGVFFAAEGDFVKAWSYFGKAILKQPVYPQLWKRMIESIALHGKK